VSESNPELLTSKQFIDSLFLPYLGAARDACPNIAAQSHAQGDFDIIAYFETCRSQSTPGISCDGAMSQWHEKHC